MIYYTLPQNFQLIQRYLIQRVIGQGGFGLTYLATDTELNKKVCIKELFIDGINQRTAESVTLTQGRTNFPWQHFIANFKKEAQKIAEFKHPNIVSVSSVFEANGTAYYVMDYVEGETLKDRLKTMGRPFNPEELKPIAAQIFDAVETVHQKGLLHRDIKPDNILITADDKIVLIDFGSARENMDEKTVELISATTMIFLTHGYAAPEMYSNTVLKGKYTDIYSLGATFYFLLTAVKPTRANDLILGAKMPNVHELNPNVSTQISSVIGLAMQIKPEDRFQTVEEFRAGIKTEEKILLPPKKKNNNTLIFSLIGIAAIVMLLIFAVPWANSSGKEANATEDKTGYNIEMVAVAGGTFTMGCTAEQGADCYDNEKPAHQVTLSDYNIGKYEVTQAQWKAVMGNNPSNFSGCDKCPVESVSWNDIQDFLRKLNEKTGKNYRLPTEAECEYAARGGNNSNKRKYSGSNILDEVAWYVGTSGSNTHEVGTKAANELGIHDMSGNVWEWCSDWYGDYDASSKTNPKGASGGSYRVLRGGCWLNNPQRCRVSFRGIFDPDFRRNFLGFRLVLVP